MNRSIATKILTIKKGEQCSDDLALDFSAIFHAVYAPENLAGFASVQSQTHKTAWCAIDGVSLRKAECCVLPQIAGHSIRIVSDMVEQDDRTFVYAYVSEQT